MKTFRDAISGKPLAISAEFPISPRTTAADIDTAAALLGPHVDAVQIYDNKAAAGHMSSLAAASLFIRHSVDAVLHVTCRDRNRIALQGELLGAAALGVTSVILSRGEKLTANSGLRGKGVFDLSDIRLTEMAAGIAGDHALMDAPGFLIGAPVTVFEPDSDWGAARISEAVDAGARFLQTQPCANARLLQHYLQAAIAKKIPHRASFVVEVPLISNRQMAESYRRDNPTALLPKSSIKKIVAADDEVAAGVSVCAAMLREATTTPGVSGVVIRDAVDARHIVAALREAGLASP